MPVAVIVAALSLGCLVAEGPAAVAQDGDAQPSAAETADPPAEAEGQPAGETVDDDPVGRELLAEYEKRRTTWAESMVTLRDAQIRFHNGGEETEEQYRQIVREQLTVARSRYDELLEQVVKMLQYNPNGGDFLKSFLAQTVAHRGHVDWYENLAKPVEMLEEFLSERVDSEFHSIAGRAQVVAGNFEQASRHLQLALQTEKPLDCDLRLLGTLDRLAAAWNAEQERLASDPDDLPLVEIETTRGKMLIELYEDQAPNTVANFIQLVDQGFYDELPFYQVVDHLFAMTGDPYGDGSGDSGHHIADEADHPDARSPLRGSLVMAKLPVPGDPQGRTVDDSASSQFMILLLPLELPAGKYTTFGRVIEGLPAVSYFTRLDPTKKTDKNEVKMPPDRILTAKVVRKRDHDYEVKYVEE
ncbi:peptidylprolyl isomerase [Roseimaritima ulvae]|uniref:peptidylprolyl isomerase n=1 Tax=Roseimaritima ulvae TaxID=980254 RepID=UPI00082DB1AE|nr:peptidylprolyl isomerase [Roseimaritima ulvae]